MMNNLFWEWHGVHEGNASVQARSRSRRITRLASALLFLGGLSIMGSQARADGELPLFTAKGFVQAGGANVQVTGYSAPSYADWNNDGLPDLIIGEKDGNYGKVRIYLNQGTKSAPVFSNYSFARNSSGTLLFAAAGCLGVFPQLCDWNGDGKMDLLAGQADGMVQVLLNENTAADPVFGAGAFLQAGPDGQKNTVTVYSRATLTLADWNNDGKTDLIVGALDGKIRVYLNDAASGTPNYRTAKVVQLGASDLAVPSGRSCPMVWDINGDGKKDLLSGNTDGQICLYLNTGTDVEPKFDSLQMLKADNQAINIGSQRSRICLADLNGDGLPDILSGGVDGLVRCYQQMPAAPPVIQYKTCGVSGRLYYMEIIGVKGLNISIDFAESLSGSVQWHPLMTTNCLTASLVVTQDLVIDPQRFFRVRQAP